MNYNMTDGKISLQKFIDKHELADVEVQSTSIGYLAFIPNLRIRNARQSTIQGNSGTPLTAINDLISQIQCTEVCKIQKQGKPLLRIMAPEIKKIPNTDSERCNKCHYISWQKNIRLDRKYYNTPCPRCNGYRVVKKGSQSDKMFDEYNQTKINKAKLEKEREEIRLKCQKISEDAEAERKANRNPFKQIIEYFKGA